MADARLTEVAEGVAALIRAGWEPAEDDEIAREYVDESKFADLRGRKVIVFGTGFREAERVSRTEVVNEYDVTVVVVERFEDKGVPLKEWLDERVYFVEQELFNRLNVDQPGELLLGSLWAETVDVPECPDPDLVLRKIFWAEVAVSYRECVVG